MKTSVNFDSLLKTFSILVITLLLVQFAVNKHEYIFSMKTKPLKLVRRVQFVVLKIYIS